MKKLDFFKELTMEELNSINGGFAPKNQPSILSTIESLPLGLEEPSDIFVCW